LRRSSASEWSRRRQRVDLRRPVAAAAGAAAATGRRYTDSKGSAGDRPALRVAAGLRFAGRNGDGGCCFPPGIVVFQALAASFSAARGSGREAGTGFVTRRITGVG